MKQKYFLSAVSPYITSAYILAYIFMVFIFFPYRGLEDNAILLKVIFLCILLCITISESKRVKTIGLYIDGNSIYFKRFRKRKININDIAGIVKVKENKSKYGGYEKDDNGELVYSAIFVTSITPLMRIFSDGTNKFMEYYPKETMFRTAYDETVINYLKELNPNIVILPEKSSSDEEDEEW